MASVASLPSAQSAFRPSRPPFCNNTERPASNNLFVWSHAPSGGQKVHKPMALAASSKDAEESTAARIEGRTPAFASDESDHELPALEELFRSIPASLSNAANKVSETGRVCRPFQQATDTAGVLVNQTREIVCGRQGDSPDLPMILDDDTNETYIIDKAKATSDGTETKHTAQDLNTSNDSARFGVFPEGTGSINTFEVHKNCHIEEPVPRREPFSQTPAESALHSTNIPGTSEDSEINPDEFENELERSWTEHMKTSARQLSTPPSLLVKALQNENPGHARANAANRHPEEPGDVDQSGLPVSEPERKQQPTSVDAPAARDIDEKVVTGKAEVVSVQQQEKKRRRLRSRTKIRSGTSWPVDTDDTCDTSDKDSHSAKRRKCHAALPRSRASVVPPNDLETDEAQSQADLEYLPSPHNTKHSCSSDPSRSPSMSKRTPIAEYQEWPFRGNLKRTRVENETTYNLEFQLSQVPEHFHIPVPSESLHVQSRKESYPDDFDNPGSVSPLTDVNHAWEIRKIVDRKLINKQKYYKVKWEETWMPEDELAGAGKLINEFEAKLRHAQAGFQEVPREQPHRENCLAIQSSITHGRMATKKPRGRPRKRIEMA